MGRTKDTGVKVGGSRDAASVQLMGALRHRHHLAEQRDAVRAAKHGTPRSKRGVRIRVNPEIPRQSRASSGVTRGGYFRG